MFKHAAIFPEHEEEVGELASRMGFRQVSLSSRVMQMVRMVPRGFTATADAYLTPHIMRYGPLPSVSPLRVAAPFFFLSCTCWDLPRVWELCG